MQTTTQHSTRRIDDDIALLPVSRQRKYQLRKRRHSCCIICGQQSYMDTSFCLPHNFKRGIHRPGRNGHRKVAV
jgi:hypothetical protein